MVSRTNENARAWYPSGPRLGSSSASSSSSYSYPSDPRDPDPKKFSIIQSIRIGDWFVSKIRYPNCSNYEGTKIIVSDFNPKTRTEIDPHFVENSGIVARFVPTDWGWEMAKKFAQSI